MLAPQIPGLVDLRPLGRGGFATVYRARQVQLGRDVAVKIDNRVLVSERDQRRFLREAHAAARLSGHPHVVGVHDANITPQGTPYLVMELCTGGSLADVLDGEGPLPAERVRQLGHQLADALAVAHAGGVLHRDVKPANVLVDRYGTAKLADFGLAALLDAAGGSTVTRDALSPSYAPPEAFAMAAPTPAGDVYALAATLYDLLAGKPPRPVPWPIESFDHLGEVLRSAVPPVPGVPADLHDVLVRALHPDAARRTPSAAQLRDELRGTPPPPPRSASRPHRVLALAGALVLLAGVAAGVWLLGENDAVSGSGGPSPASARQEQEDAPPFLAVCDTGFCVAEPTCYLGINNFGGSPAAARRTADCSTEHRWEAFAGGWLSGPVPAVPSDELLVSAEVAGVCTPEAMRTNTRPAVDTTGWQREAVGFTDGDRSYFHCLATRPEGGALTTSAFGSR
ncbi:serine/threonine-protein kinase [Umezawaea beigongshangensis]|uniref:serine/threonine-protein kinase n=1 Tax=Umezawaea beigongshangensis TaxID=2780383 RepID=UPI0018F18A6A|nr:serine/threonine-protein kinase [Umezawaea beigongshangensis]